MENLFALGMSDDSKSWHLQTNGTWLRNGGRNAIELVDVQDQLMLSTLRRGTNR